MKSNCKQKNVFLGTPLLILLLIFSSGFLIAGEQEKIVIYKSKNLSAYNLAEKGFINKIKGKYKSHTTDFELNIEKARNIIRKRFPKGFCNKKTGDYVVVYAIGALALEAVKERLYNCKRVQVIYSVVLNPESIVDFNFKNITGVSLDVDWANTLTQVKLIAPAFNHVLVLYSVARSMKRFHALKEKASLFNIHLLPVRIKEADREKTLEKTHTLLRTIGDYLEEKSELAPEKYAKRVETRIRNQQLSAVLKSKIQGIIMLPDPNVYDTETFRTLLSIAVKHKIPFVASSENFVKAGALFSTSPDYGVIGEQAAMHAIQALKSRKTTPSGSLHPPLGTYTVLNKKVVENTGLTLSGQVIENLIDKIIE